MYSFSIRQFIWEYIDDFIFWRESSLMYSFSIRQFIWEYIGDFYDSWMFGPHFILMLLMFGGEGGGLLIRCWHYIPSTSINFIFIQLNWCALSQPVCLFCCWFPMRSPPGSHGFPPQAMRWIKWTPREVVTTSLSSPFRRLKAVCSKAGSLWPGGCKIIYNVHCFVRIR